MGFLDQLLRRVVGDNKEDEAAQKSQGVTLFEEVSNWITQSDGVGGLAQQFEQKGLGPMVAAWIGTGANPDITADQVANAIGQDRIRAIAAKVGLSEEQVSQSIAKLLPAIVDKLTPSGKIPEQTPEDMRKTLEGLKSKFL